MFTESDLNILVSNVICENLNKHCRLCLKEITGSYIDFGDYVSYDEETFHPFNEVLRELLGTQILDEVPGVNVICPNCLQKTLECLMFINQIKTNNKILYRTFNNLYEALSVDLDISDNRRLYMVIGSKESAIMLVDKDSTDDNALKDPAGPLGLSHIIKIKSDNISKETRTENDITTKLDTKCNGADNLETHRWPCKHCRRKFPSENNMEEHETFEHTVHVCKECGKCCKGLKRLLEHEVSHGTTSLICKQCGKTCKGKEKLEAHELKHNVTKGPRQCPKCNKVYLTEDFYLKHVELCLSDKLEKHPFRAKMEKKYLCDKCDKGYSCQAGLNVHKKFVHGQCKGHVCEFCGKSFSAPSVLKTHMIKHSGKKNFICNICSRNFVTKEALLYHTRRHTGEKPYSCKLCDQRFVNASARAEHIKYKHESPKFLCIICNKKFFTSSYLKQHHQIHKRRNITTITVETS